MHVYNKFLPNPQIGFVLDKLLLFHPKQNHINPLNGKLIMPYNPAIHNRHSIRLQGYDYSETGSYFITICTYKKEHLFGEIVNSEIKLNLIGQYAYHQWKQIPQRFENVELNEFVIMPNHIHGIIVIVSGRGEGLENKCRFPPKSTFSNPSPLVS